MIDSFRDNVDVERKSLALAIRSNMLTRRYTPYDGDVKVPFIERSAFLMRRVRDSSTNLVSLVWVYLA